jgi:Family of unknown function (DUF5996)
MPDDAGGPGEPWPDIPYPAWRETCETLHRWTQIVGKTRLALEPLVNHWWQVPLYVSARGLTTSAMPYGGGRLLEVEFDFPGRELALRMSDGGRRAMVLAPRSVADFYAEYRRSLADLGVEVAIWPVPVELPDALPFPEDEVHAAYDAAAAERFWRALVHADRLFKAFRARFLGKSSPVHFFWGSFDLSVSRFSGRRAPEREGADAMTREAYSHECSSAGFWPGGGGVDGAAFYSYTVPEPEGFAAARVQPPAAIYHQGLHEFLLMYNDARTAPSPKAALLDFFESTYEAGATLGRWDRVGLDRGAAG